MQSGGYYPSDYDHNTNGTYKIDCEEPGRSIGEGWIKPEDHRFHLRYSTY